MKLVKTTIYSALIAFIRISSGFFSGKVVAVFTGPLGVALIGSFTNFISIISTIASGAISTGVIKYTAEFTEDKKQLKSLISTSFKITVVCSIVVSLVILIFSNRISVLIFSNQNFIVLIRLVGITMIFYSLNSLFISILNGMGEIKSFTIVNTVGSIVGLLLTILLVYFFKILGALYALVFSQSLVFFITATMIVRSPWFTWKYFYNPFDKLIARKLSIYSLMAVVSALTVPVSQIVLRNMLTNKLDINSAGYWQGMLRISDGYLMLITTSLSTYYLPKLSSLKLNFEIKAEIYRGYKIILPTVFVGCCLIYFSRFLIIKILYTPEFLNMEALFLWQLIGDFFKMAAWILGYLMIAKAMIKVYIITEITFTILYVTLGYILVYHFQIQGITFAFCITYFISFLFFVIFFRKLLFSKEY